jgi:hypothetical protein
VHAATNFEVVSELKKMIEMMQPEEDVVPTLDRPSKLRTVRKQSVTGRLSEISDTK